MLKNGLKIDRIFLIKKYPLLKIKIKWKVEIDEKNLNC